MQMTETTILVPYGKAGGFESVRARSTNERGLYELAEHAFVHLIPGDVLEVDDFGVTINVRSYRQAGLIEVFFEEGLRSDVVDRFVEEVALTHDGVSTHVESAVACLVAHKDAGVLKQVVDLAGKCGADFGKIIRRPDVSPSVDIWNLDKEEHD